MRVPMATGELVFRGGINKPEGRMTSPLSEIQRIMLLNLIKEKSDVIKDKSQSPGVIERKKKAWAHVRDTFNAMNPHCPRTESQLKRAYEHVKRRVKEEQIKYRKMSLKMDGQPVTPPKFTKDRAIAASIMGDGYAVFNDIFEIFTCHGDTADSSMEDVSTKEEDLQDPSESTDPLLTDHVTTSPLGTSHESITVTTAPSAPVCHFISPPTDSFSVVPSRYVPITSILTPQSSSSVQTSATAVPSRYVPITTITTPQSSSSVQTSATLDFDVDKSVKRPGKRKRVNDEYDACRERQTEHHSLKMKHMEEHHSALMKEHDERMNELKLKTRQEELRFKEQELKLEEQKKNLVEQETRLRLLNFAEEAAKLTLARLKQSFNKLDQFLDSGNSAYQAMSKSYK